MDEKKILLILALFLGVSLADKVPGFFRDRSVPNKWSLSLWKNHKARDQPESEDTRTMNTKQTEDSSHTEVRHKLPLQDTAWFSPEKNAAFTAYCDYKDITKTLSSFEHRGRKYFPVQSYYRERICDPPDDDIEEIHEVAHQKCKFKDASKYYCFTREEDVKVSYKTNLGGGRWKIYHKVTKLRTGCVCGSLHFRKR